MYVGTDENTFNLIDGLDVGNVLTHTSTALNYLPNTQYYWKVVPYNDFGNANGCTVWTFKSLNVPNCPTMPFPAPAATDVVRNSTLTWTAPTSPSATSYDVYFGTSANPSFVANVTGTSYTPTAMLSNTTYYWKIVSKNVMGSSQECSEGSFTTGIDLVYCNPSSTSWNTYINNFTTTLGNANISNLNSGYTTGGYQNNYGQSTVVTYAGGNFNYEFSIVGGTAGAAIWIDWDSSGTFSTSERVFVTSSYGNGPFSGTISIPAGAALGDYRMRVMVDYSASAPSNSCMTANSRTETEDYKITVGPQPSCVIPTGFSTTTITSSTALINWTASVSSPSNGYDIYYSTSNISPTAGITPLINNNVASSANANGLTSATTYYWWVRSDCGNMTSVWAYGGSFVTLCNPVSEFSQNWDSVTAPALPTCFAKVGTLGAVTTQSSNAVSGVNTLYMYASSTSNEPTLALPEINNAQAGTHWLKFKLRANSSVGGKLQVGYLTNPADASTFVMIQEFTATTLTYAEFTCVTGTLPNGVKHLALKAKGSPANSVLIDDLAWEVLPSCMAPTALSSSNITENTANLSWTASISNSSNGYDVYYSSTNTAPTTLTIPLINNHLASLLTINGLVSATTYYWWVRTNCSSETSLWAYGGSFKTALDYCAGDRFYDTGGASGNYLANENITTVITPTAGNLVTVTFNSFSTESGWDFLKVYDGPNASSPALHTGSGFSGSTAVPGPFTSTHPSGKLTFVFTSDGSTQSSGWDATVVCTPLPSCLAPTALTNGNITSVSATLSWTASISNPSNGYDIYYSTSNIAPIVETTPSINNELTTSLNASGLISATTYYWWVRSDCGNDTSVWTYGGSFTTLCTSVSEFSQNWDSVTTPALPTCFAKVGTLGSVYTQTSNPASGVNTLFMYASSTSSEPTLVLPEINNAQAGTHWLKFKLRANSSVGGKLQVGYLTNPSDESTFVMIEEFTASTLIYAEFVCMPGTLPNGIKYLALKAKGSPSNSMLIDDLVWESIPSCIAPTALSATLASLSAADLSWNASTSVDLESYQWEVRTSGLPGSGNTGLSASGVTAAGITNAIASNLDLNTTVTLYVRTVCQDNNFSEWKSSLPLLINYCISAPSSNDNDGITNVKLGDTSFGVSDVTYYDYPTVINLQAGVLNSSAVTFATGYTYNTHIWIDLNKNGIHPDLGEVTLEQLLSTWVVHDLTHIAQISRVMAKQYKEVIGPWSAYFRILEF
ncbi:MAG: hypothetical protein EOO43_02700 [Flavobacterium sp.]|nr:MAG: hypothetical protein EOO43_02700 [Flavobacterium sp.]